MNPGVQIATRQHYYSQRGRGYSEEIAAGEALLLNEGRAYWDFTALSGNNDDIITSVPDLTGNGWDLNNNSDTLTPKVGMVMVGTQQIPCFKATTPNGDESALITPAPTTNLLKGSIEIYKTIDLSDGQHVTALWMMGGGSGSNQLLDVYITPLGAVRVRYAANNTTFSVVQTADGVMTDGFTGIVLLRIRLDLVADVFTTYLNGVPYAMSLLSGNALSLWNPDNWVLAGSIGIGGKWSGTAFVDDAAGVLKNYLKCAVTELLTDEEALNVSLAMLDI